MVLYGSKLTYESIAYLCNNVTPTPRGLNISRERARNEDILAEPSEETPKTGLGQEGDGDQINVWEFSDVA